MKTIVLLLTAILFLSSIFSQGLNDICTSGQLNVFAVGPAGKVLKSTNAGTSYSSSIIGIENLNSVFAIGNNVWIAGDNGSLYISNNLGLNWQNLSLGSGARLNAFYFVDSLTGFCAADNGLLFKTVNSGINWSALASGVSFNIYKLKFINNNTGYFSGENNSIYQTTNGGLNWISITTPSLTSIRCFDVLNNEIIAGSSENNLYRSTDLGSSWSAIDLKIQSIPGINDVIIRSQSSYIILLESGTIWNTTDGGQSFSYCPNEFLDELNTLTGTGSRFYAASKRQTAVIRSLTAGTSWSLTPNSTYSINFHLLLSSTTQNSNKLLCFNYQKRGVLYALQNNQLYRSLNYGNNWSVISTIPDSLRPNTQLLISSDDSAKMLAGVQHFQPPNTYINYLFRTSDYGGSWQMVRKFYIDPIGNYMNFDPQHPDTVYLGSADSVFRSIDFGLTWNKISEYRFEDWCDITIHPSNSQILYGATNHYPAKIHKSTNGGLNWNLLDLVPDTTYSEMPVMATSNLKPEMIFHAQYNNNNNYKGLKRSFNGGFSWSFTQFPGISWSVDIAKDNPGLIAYGNVSYDPVFLSSNSGSGFIGTANNYSEQILYYDNANLFTNNHGAIYKMKVTYNMPVIGIESVSNEIPLSYLLKQNYPNPFNPDTKIEFSIPVNSNVKIKIYDALGREIAGLLDENLIPGNYSVTFNAENLPSGVYFYSLQSEKFNNTKKMILIK